MKKRKVQTVLCVQNDSELSFLLLKTNKKRGQFWQNVTGSVEKDEKFEHAAIREAIEESQLDENNIIEMFELFEYSFKKSNNKKVIERVFCILCKDKWDVIIDPKEHEDFFWETDFKKCLEMIKFESNQKAVTEVKNILCGK